MRLTRCLPSRPRQFKASGLLSAGLVFALTRPAPAVPLPQSQAMTTSGVSVKLPDGWRATHVEHRLEARSPDGSEYFRDGGTSPSILDFMIEVDTDRGYRRAQHPEGRILYLKGGPDGHDYRFFVKLGQVGWTFECHERPGPATLPSICLSIASTARLAAGR